MQNVDFWPLPLGTSLPLESVVLELFVEPMSWLRHWMPGWLLQKINIYRFLTGGLGIQFHEYNYQNDLIAWLS